MRPARGRPQGPPRRVFLLAGYENDQVRKTGGGLATDEHEWTRIGKTTTEQNALEEGRFQLRTGRQFIAWRRQRQESRPDSTRPTMTSSRRWGRQKDHDWRSLIASRRSAGRGHLIVSSPLGLRSIKLVVTSRFHLPWG